MADTFEIAVNHAILHILDFTTRLNVLSQKELDLDNDKIYGYIFRHIYKTADDPRRKTVSFEEDSELLKAFRDYRRKTISFIDLSDAIAQRFIDFFTDHPDLQAFDLLIADFSLDLRPTIAVLVLDNVQAWTHQVDNSTGVLMNDIVEHHAVLPSPSARMKTYALVDLSDESIRYTDAMKTGTEKQPQIIRQVLQCTENKSADEVLKIVRKITEEVAEDHPEEHEEHTAVILSKAKTFIRRSAEESASFEPEELADEIFEEHPVMKQIFTNRLKEADLPKKVEMPEPAAKKMSKHRIRTDTGIEISLPAEYFSDPDYINFISLPNGKITIELKNIGKIINR